MKQELKDTSEQIRDLLYSEPTARDFFLNLLAAMPGGDELEKLGYKPNFFLGWLEVGLLKDMLRAINTEYDVRELINLLIKDEQ